MIYKVMSSRGNVVAVDLFRVVYIKTDCDNFGNWSVVINFGNNNSFVSISMENAEVARAVVLDMATKMEENNKSFKIEGETE